MTPLFSEKGDRFGRPAVNLKIPYGKNIEDGLILHTARHTITTHLVESGLDYDTIGLITGHKAKKLIAHYSHKTSQSVARAAAALEQIAVRRDPDSQKP
jgi:integrase